VKTCEQSAGWLTYKHDLGQALRLLAPGYSGC